MLRIRTLDPIAGLEDFDSRRFVVGAEEVDPHGLLVRSTPVLLRSYRNLRVIGRAGAGVDNIDVDEALKLGIAVFAAPGENAPTVTERVWGSILSHVSRLPEAQSLLAAADPMDADSLEKWVKKNKRRVVGTEVYRKTLGVVGLGNIGVRVANIGVALNMRVIAYEPRTPRSNGVRLSSEVVRVEMDDLLRDSDFITLHASYSKGEPPIIAKQQLAMMQNGVVLVNFARAELCDEEAVVEALEAKRLTKYIVDLPTSFLQNLRHHPQLIRTPHIGAGSKESETRCGKTAVKRVQDFLMRGFVSNSVNFPDADFEADERARTRLAIVNRDVPNMIAIEASVFGEARINICGFFNRSDKTDTIGYTLVDFKTEVPDELILLAENLPGVINVRRMYLGLEGAS